jgi:diaminopimelate epimerase
MKNKVLIPFSKYQGTGNDFILIDARSPEMALRMNSITRESIAKWCDRRFGIGADGLILMKSKSGFDFEMKNYNSDGGECTMCGNGGRTLVQFALDSGVHAKDSHYRFWAMDGEHEAWVEQDITQPQQKKIHLKMQDISSVTENPLGFVLNTGSPHLVRMQPSLMDFDVVTEGRRIRSNTAFLPGGINVNFIEPFGHQLYVRTYERGVEDETLSCGTGIIAAAIVYSQQNPSSMENPGLGVTRTRIQTRGG